jgi:hypothetical protein
MTESTGMERSLAFTALMEVEEFRHIPQAQASALVTLFLEDYRHVVSTEGVKVGQTDMVTWAKKWMEGHEIRTGARPVPRHLQDDGVPLERYTNGRGLGSNPTPGKAQVVRKVNDRPGVAMKYRYDVVLEVDHDWQAVAIAAILNAG